MRVLPGPESHIFSLILDFNGVTLRLWIDKFILWPGPEMRIAKQAHFVILVQEKIADSCE